MALDMDNPPAVERPKTKTGKARGAPKKTLEQMTLEEKLNRPEAQKMREAFRKKYGKGSLAGVSAPMPKIQVVSTGLPNLDSAVLGNGNPERFGLPRGYAIEFRGKESSGKSSLVMYICGHLQAQGEHVVWIDLERTMDENYARLLGVDTTLWDYSVPGDGTEAGNMILDWANFGANVIVLDSVGVMDPKDDMDKPIDDASQVSGNIHIINRLLARTAKVLYVNKTILILINQVRVNFGAKSHQAKTKSTGGNRLSHALVQRLDVRKGEKIKQGDNVLGYFMEVFAEKNKVAPPWGRCSLPLMFNQGISADAVIFEEAVRCKLVSRRGAWYSYADELLGQGKAAALEYLKEHEELFLSLKNEMERRDAKAEAEDTVEDAPEDMDTLAVTDGMEIVLE